MKTVIKMAREAGFVVCRDESVLREMLERFAELVRADEREAMMQLFTDPENQPTQHGTVTVNYMQLEIADEREACAKVCETVNWYDSKAWASDIAAAIRARGEASIRSNA